MRSMSTDAEPLLYRVTLGKHERRRRHLSIVLPNRQRAESSPYAVPPLGCKDEADMLDRADSDALRRSTLCASAALHHSDKQLFRLE